MERLGQGTVCVTPAEAPKSKGIFRIRLIKEPLLLKVAQKMCQAFQTGWPIPLPAAYHPCFALPDSPLGQQNLSPPVCPGGSPSPRGVTPCDDYRSSMRISLLWSISHNTINQDR